jgi:hypothetical protein
VDDIKIKGHFDRDRIAPRIDSLRMFDRRHIQIWFSEEVVFPNPSSFRIIPGELLVNDGPDNLAVADTLFQLDHGYVVRFPMMIPNREEVVLGVNGICDPEGNCLTDTLVPLMRNDPVWGDVVITEIMFDPDPPVMLPEQEYLEILNRSSFAMNLENWRLEVNERIREIEGMMLDPGQYTVISDVTLPNDGATIALYSDKDILVHGARYGSLWDEPDWKKEGGWSLESPDPDRVCNVSSLWRYSTDRRGGTPGEVNSVDSSIPDDEEPVLLGYGYSDSVTIRLSYSESLKPTIQDDYGDQFFRYLPVGTATIIPGSVYPDSITMSKPISDQLFLHFHGDYLDRSFFKLRMEPVSDCSGNYSQPVTIHAGKPAIPEFGSLVINEIMYDPQDWAPAFIELYNPGIDHMDLKEISLELIKKGSISGHHVPVSSRSRMIGPDQYMVLTKDRYHLMNAYKLEESGRWLELKGLTGFSGSGGTIHLTDRSGMMVDRARYHDQMHMELLDNTTGVSLERITPERSGADPGNWHSAASLEGYSTPGKPNSQSMGHAKSDNLLNLEPAVFSPDNDGYEDLLVITVTTGTQGSVLRLWITDLSGNRIRILANNHMAGPEARYVWDGEREDGSMASEGFYVVHLQGYDQVSGEKWNKRTAAGVIYR